MSDVPSELYWEILIRLPAESLLRFRSVCKSWLHIIDDPSFIKEHTNNQIYNHTLLVKDKTLYSFSLDSLNFLKDLQNIEATRIKPLIRRCVPRLRDLFDVASCNGLILLSDESINRVWAIWNPLTGDFHELHPPNAALSSNGFGFGFGYDACADDYKVVRVDRLFSAGKIVYQSHVYSLKSECWSMIEDSPVCIPLLNPGVFLNGTLYWISGDIIIALDLRTESYSQFPLPPVIINASKNCGKDISALDGCLIISLNHYQTSVFDGWVMEAAEKKSWVKLFSLQLPYCIFEDPLHFKLVAYLKGKEEAVVQYSRGFAWFDFGINNSFMCFPVHEVWRFASSKICPGSLVRLGTAAKKNSKKRDSRRKWSWEITLSTAFPHRADYYD